MEIEKLPQHLVDAHLQQYLLIEAQLRIYDRLLEQGHELSEQASGDIEDLLLLQDYYKRMLDGRE